MNEKDRDREKRRWVAVKYMTLKEGTNKFTVVTAYPFFLKMQVAE
jgi:hypothetical protein